MLFLSFVCFAKLLPQSYLPKKAKAKKGKTSGKDLKAYDVVLLLKLNRPGFANCLGGKPPGDHMLANTSSMADEWNIEIIVFSFIYILLLKCYVSFKFSP